MKKIAAKVKLVLFLLLGCCLSVVFCSSAFYHGQGLTQERAPDEVVPGIAKKITCALLCHIKKRYAVIVCQNKHLK
jgi:hypothetical protein